MSWYHEIGNKLRHVRGRGRFDESLEEEVRLHIESRVEELRGRGMAEEEALSQARREFGSTLRIGEETREAWRWGWVEDLVRDLRHGAHALSRDRGFAAAAILSLALGIGVNTTIFSLTAEFLFSQPSVRSPETLVQARVGGGSQVPQREYRFLRDAKVFDSLTGANEMQEVNWRTAESSVRLFMTRVSENFFEVTGIPVAKGRAIQSRERLVAVISHRFWQTRLDGDLNVLGRVLVLDGQAHIVVGVLPVNHRTLLGFGYSPDLYIPIANENDRVALYGRLPAGTTAGAAVGPLRSAAAELDRQFPDGTHKWAEEVSVAGLSGLDRLRDGFLPTVSALFAMLMAVVGLLLLIACANVASLLLARASTRMHEFAVRMSIGAGRGRLIRQLLAESLLLSVLGTVVGLGLNYVLTRMLNTVTFTMPFPMRLSIQPDERLLLYAALIAMGSALVAGLLPAIFSTRAGTSALLKWNEHQVSGRRATLRNLLVTGQLAVSVVVLIVAALSIRNLIRSTTLDPGFDLQHTTWAQMRIVPESYPGPTKTRAVASVTLDQLRALPQVESATVASLVALNDHFAARVANVYTDVLGDGARLEHSYNTVGPDYFQTMGIRMVAGREFTAADREGSQRVVVLNESFARRVFGKVNPVGQRIRIGRDDRLDRRVIGVARNSKYSTIGEVDRAAMFEPYLQAGGGRASLNFFVRTAAPDGALKTVNAVLLAVDSTAAVEVKRMSNATAFALLPSRVGAVLLGAIGLLGLALASVGLYGVLTYATSRRTREIGLRVALGAQRPQVLRLVLSEGAVILGAGLAVGFVVALLLTRPLERFLVPGLRTSDPVTYGVVAVVLVAVAAAASLTPALRALRIDPMMALRYE